MDLDGRAIVRRSSLGARRRRPSRECIFRCTNAFSLGAMAVAHTTLVPVLLAERELTAFAGLLREFSGYPLASVPYRVPRWGDYQQASAASLHERWRRMASEAGVGAPTRIFLIQRLAC